HHISNYRPGKIMSRAAYEELGEDYAFQPIGTGPFVFERWTPHEEVVLLANEDYFEGAPILEKATFQIISEDTVSAMAMEAGELDSMLVSLEEVYERFVANPDMVLEELASTSTRYYNIKTVQEPFDDVRVRRAMAHATDREGVAEVVGMGAKPLYAMIPEGMFGYSEDIPYHEFDLDLAAELLEEAGYPDGFETEYYGRDIEVEQDVFAYLQSLYRQIGVDVKMNTMDSTAWTEATTRGESPMAWLSLSARHDPDGILSGFFHGSVSSPHGRNFTWYSGADDLINAARLEMDPERRAEIYRELQIKFYEDVPTIPLFQPTIVRASQLWVKGLKVGQVEDSYLYPVSIEGRGN
ncbi:MAG: ABC transporter substrate-binding protein, partial [Bacillota bacterium]